MKIIDFLEYSIIILTAFFIILLIIYIAPFKGNNPNLLSGFGLAVDKPSPEDIIKENQIEIYPDMVIIRVPNAILSSYAPTKSMDPLIDSSANGIEIPVTSKEQINVGDIIAFQSSINANELIVHRVIEVGEDSEGWYCITKGDNNIANDGKIRFNQIKFETIAIIY